MTSMSGAPLGHKWQEAVSFAVWAHRHQLRKDGRTPYAAHVIRVAMTVTRVFHCDDEITLCAALLHDTIEDTTTDYDDLEHRFGRDVADCVAALTKNMALPEQAREKEYDARLAAAGWRVKLVKLADTYDNLHDALRTAGLREKLGTHLEKCDRALALLTPEDLKREEITRAARAVTDLCDVCRKLP